MKEKNEGNTKEWNSGEDRLKPVMEIEKKKSGLKKKKKGINLKKNRGKLLSIQSERKIKTSKMC